MINPPQHTHTHHRMIFGLQLRRRRGSGRFGRGGRCGAGGSTVLDESRFTAEPGYHNREREDGMSG